MSHQLPFLRSTALAVATLLGALASSTNVTTMTTAAISATAVLIATSDAEAGRAQVRDHRWRRGPRCAPNCGK